MILPLTYIFSTAMKANRVYDPDSISAANVLKKLREKINDGD